MDLVFPREVTGWKKLAEQGRKLRESQVVEEIVPTEQQLAKIKLIEELLSMNDKDFKHWNNRRKNWFSHSQRVQELRETFLN